MSAIQINKNGEETSFSKPIKRALLRDKRLIFYARGLFAMLWDFPSNWIFYKSYLVEMSPEGKYKLERHIKELKQFGALTILPRQLPYDEAIKKATAVDKTYRAGQFAGFNWTLNHPDLWAIEAPLSRSNDITRAKNDETPPKYQFIDVRQNRASDLPTFGKSEAKGLQQQGSTIKEPPLPHLSEQKPFDSQNAPQNLNASSGSNSELFYPKQLTLKERELAKTQLAPVLEKVGQEILDELAARLNANSIKSSPLAYMRALITRAQHGQFTPEAGVRVALARDQALAQKSKVQSSILTPTDPKDVPKYLSAMHKALGRKQPEEQE